MIVHTNAAGGRNPLTKTQLKDLLVGKRPIVEVLLPSDVIWCEITKRDLWERWYPSAQKYTIEVSVNDNEVSLMPIRDLVST